MSPLFLWLVNTCPTQIFTCPIHCIAGDTFQFQWSLMMLPNNFALSFQLPVRGHGGDADPGAAGEEAGAGGRRPDRRQAGQQAHLRRPQVPLRAEVKCSSRKYGSKYLWLIILSYLWWQNLCRVKSRALNRQSYCIHALRICVIYWCLRHPKGLLVHGSINCTSHRPSLRSSGIYIHICI